MLIERGERSLNGFLRVGFEHSNVHQLSHYVGAGLVWSGPLLTSAEREEQLGIAVGVLKAAVRSGVRKQRWDGACSVTRLRSSSHIACKLCPGWRCNRMFNTSSIGNGPVA